MFFFSEKTSKEKRKVQQRKVAERRVVDGFWQDGVGVWGAEASVPEAGLLEDQVGGDWNSLSNLSILNCQEISRHKDSWKLFLRNQYCLIQAEIEKCDKFDEMRNNLEIKEIWHHLSESKYVQTFQLLNIASITPCSQMQETQLPKDYLERIHVKLKIPPI